MLIRDSHLPVLIDPVCGMPVNAASPHSCVRGGAMFSFCSEACRARFIDDPLRFVFISVPEHEVPAPTPDPLETVVREEPDRPVAGEQSARKSDDWELEHRLQRGGLRGWMRLGSTHGASAATLHARVANYLRCIATYLPIILICPTANSTSWW